MAVIRINKTVDYTVMSNAHFKEKEMSLKAKGLLSLMLSLPDNWDYSIAGLVAICKENETAIKSTLNELKSFGYLVVTKRNPNETESGRFEYEYNIYEQPQEKQSEEKQGVEIQPLENQGQLNTNKSNTNELNTNNKKKERKTSTYDDIINSKIEDDELKELICEFIKMRKLKKKPLTDRALTIQLNKLLKLSSNLEEQKAIVDKTIVKCWDEFYPLKEESKGSVYNGNKRIYEPTIRENEEEHKGSAIYL